MLHVCNQGHEKKSMTLLVVVADTEDSVALVRNIAGTTHLQSPHMVDIDELPTIGVLQ